MRGRWDFESVGRMAFAKHESPEKNTNISNCHRTESKSQSSQQSYRDERSDKIVITKSE